MAAQVLTECFSGDLCHFSVSDFSEPAHESSYSVLIPLGQRGDHQDAVEGLFAALITFWVASLTGSCTVFLQQDGRCLLTGGEADLPSKPPAA